MNMSRIFILRPVATSLLMIALVLVGLVSAKFLPISSLPDVEYPTIQVTTFYPGASPQVMATTVTAPLEVQLGEIPGLSQMTSISSSGASVVTLQFDLSLSLDIAEQDVQQAINAANSLLPTGLPAPPTYAKVNPADQPILTLAITSDSLSLTQLQDLANNRLASKISEVTGVGVVTPAGGNIPAVRVEVDPKKMSAYNLNIDDLRTLLANINVSNPKGNFDGPDLDYTINANDQIQNPDDYLNTVIAYQNGSPVFMRDVARVAQAAQDIGQQSSGHRAQRDASARRERDQDREPDQDTAAHPVGQSAAGHACRDRVGRHQRDPRLGARRRVRTAGLDWPGGAGDFPVPSQSARHPDSEYFGSGVPDRNACNCL
jgi:multidrug efflux pump